MERYCSSYYDRHGLYNDGFPCPGKTYCCEKDDGHKMCCPEVTATLNKNPHGVATSTILQRILQKDKQQGFYNHLDSLAFNTNNNNRELGAVNDPFQLQSPASSISFSISNSAQLLGVCLAFGALVIITSLALGCVFRYCTKSYRKSSPPPEKQSAHHHNTYSRNSSASSGSSNATSSTANNSPKGATEIDEEDLDECQNILTIDPNAHHLNQSHLSSRMQPLTNNSQNLILQSGRSNNMSDYLLQTQRNSLAPNMNTIYSSLNQPSSGHYANAMSSGSSSVCTSLLLNNLNNINSANTTQSFIFNSMSNNMNDNNNNLNLIRSNDEENTEDEADCEPTDFISSTTSNLEFLKTHSLFNSTPMNYYPTLGLSLNKPVPTVVETQPIYSEAKKTTTLPTSTVNQTNPGDFRFSTFLPTTATATASSTTTAIYVNKQNDLI